MAGLAMATLALDLAPGLVRSKARSNVEWPRKPLRFTPIVASTSAWRPRLDEVRDEAAGGSEFANLNLPTALLDSYDQTSDRDELYEAIVRIDWLWEASSRAEPTARVVAQYRAQRVVRWHRVCALGG